MLVLSRRVGEELVIGDNIRIVISRVAGNRVAVGIDAPQDVHVVRGELKAIRDGFQDERSGSEKRDDGRQGDAEGCDESASKSVHCG